MNIGARKRKYNLRPIERLYKFDDFWYSRWEGSNYFYFRKSDGKRMNPNARLLTSRSIYLTNGDYWKLMTELNKMGLIGR